MKWLKNHIGLGWLISGIATFTLLLSTTPERIGPQGVTAFFGLFYIWMFFSAEIILRLFDRHKERNLRNTKHFFLTAVLAIIPTFVLALQSLDQLVWRDVAIIFSLSAVIVFYWMKRGYN